MNKNVATITWVFSAIFLVLAAQGFVADLLITQKVLYKTNVLGNITYLTTAIGFAIVTKLGVSMAIQFIRVIGIIYMLISLFGFMEMNIQINDQWKDVAYFNIAAYIQFGIGVVLSLFGSKLMNHQLLEVTCTNNNL